MKSAAVISTAFLAPALISLSRRKSIRSPVKPLQNLKIGSLCATIGASVL
jgi:hypothetical protein